MLTLDMDIKLEIDLAALGHCLDRPDFDETIPPGAQMTDDDVRAGILKVFADADGWKDWMLDVVLKSYRQAQAEWAMAQEMANVLVGSLMGRAWE